MDSEEQPINPNDLVIFKNIDTQDHEWQYDAIKTPLPYYIRAGETRELPYYIATHGIEKLIDKILMRQGKIHTSPLLRNELRRQIFLGLKHINYIREKTPNELALEDMQRKKESDPYKELIKERQIEADRASRATIPKVSTPLIEEKGMVQNNPIAPIVPNVSNPDNPIVPTDTTLNNIEAPAVTIDQDRENVYNLLRNKLHMDLAHQKTKEKLDSMSVDALKQEFSTELPELSNPEAQVVPDTREVLSEDGMPVKPTAPQIPTPPPPQPTTPPAPAITMNPAAQGAPLLDQQLGK